MNKECEIPRRIPGLIEVGLLIWSVTIALAQTGPPIIQAQPQSVAVAVGATVTLSVVADGGAPLSYQWEFMGTNLDGATQAILSITNAQPAQSGLYSVWVSNSQAVVSSTTALLSVVGIQGWGVSGPGLTNIPTGLSNIVSISVLHDHCLALTDNGQVVAWGDNSYGLLNVPADLTNAIAIAAGDDHYVALRGDGNVTVWGNQSWVPGGLGKVTGIAAGDSGVSFALRSDGTLVGWGFYGDTNVPSGLTNVVRIASGGSHHIALKADGTLVSWGPNNYFGQLNPPADLTNVVAIAAAEEEGMALLADGSVVAWGANTNGETQVPAGLTDVVAIALSDSHCLALKSDGTVVAWGDLNGITPAPLSLPEATGIAAGDFFSLVLLEDSAPHITVEPWDQTVTPGMSAQFTCKAVGQSLNYQWQLNGTNIPGATTDTFFNESSQPSNAGVYALVVTNQLGMTTSRPASLSVFYAITVQPPVLPMQPDQTVDELSQLVVTNTATDVVVPNLTLTYQLWNAPSGASIDGNGVIRWTPALSQAPSTNVFTTIVTDNALPPATATNTFLVLVLATNQPPVLDLPASWTLVSQTPFSEQVLATDPDDPVSSLVFTLGAGAPSGASISPGGLFSWAPGPDQAPSTNLVTIWVSDSLNSVSQSIEILVYPLNTTQPVLPTQPDRIIFGQTELVVANTATDSDTPPDTLTYELLFAPAGATIDTNGIIRWTPLPDQEPSTNFFTTQVTDSGMPPLSRRNIFSVVALVSNQAPVLQIPDSWTLTEGVAFSQQVTVSDPYEPAASLTFTLPAGAPLGATMTPTGLFSWVPTESQAPSTNPVAICVTDGTSTFCKTIQIIVNQSPLEILSQPLGGSFGIGYDASLSVLARGTTPVSYQWQFNGTNMPGATGATLTLSNAEPAQSGTYSVIVSNQSGAITSNPVSVSIVPIISWENGLPDERSNIPANLTNVVGIAGGDAFDVALNADGTVAAWGANIFSQLDVPADATNIVAIAAGSSHALALRADGTVVTWGTMWPTNVPVPIDLTNAVAVDVGRENNLALRSDGTVVSWGVDSADFRLRCVGPVGLSNVVAISAGNGWDLAIKSDGTVVAWDDGGGEFTPVPADLTNVVAVSCGQFGTLALKSDGTVEGWLANPLFDPNLLIGALPPNLTNVATISAKGDHGLALLADGTVVAWGTNGLNTVPAGLSGVVAITGALGQSMALLRNGSPHVTVQPWDSSVAAGAAATLNAKAVGLQSMNYQWRQNGADIPGATNDSYSIASVEPANAGGYTLLVSNRVGATLSREAKLSVVETIPPVLSQPANYTVNAGQTVTFANSAVDVYSDVQLTFSLAVAPPGATINSQTGVFTWRPPVSSAGTTNEVIVGVTDNNTPPLSDSKAFYVSVNELQPTSIAPSLEAGQLHFILTGTTGPDYILQASNDLVSWADLQTNTPALMPFDFATPAASLSTHQFYRLRLGP